MKRKEFLEELESHLIGLSKEDVKEIVEDYEEHFKVGKKNKRKESEICKSLGDPRQIAKEARRELRRKDDSPLKEQAIESWVELKKFSKKIFEDFKNAMEGLSAKANKKEVKRTKKQRKENRTGSSFWKTFGLLCFNLIIFIWVWISVFAALIALIISGVAIFVSGIIVIAFSIFALISYNNELTKDILFSLLFSGIGITILGDLFTVLFSNATKLFFKGTKKYIKLNSRLMKK
jgi:uncharacterized membrane protein